MGSISAIIIFSSCGVIKFGQMRHVFLIIFSIFGLLPLLTGVFEEIENDPQIWCNALKFNELVTLTNRNIMLKSFDGHDRKKMWWKKKCFRESLFIVFNLKWRFMKIFFVFVLRLGCMARSKIFEFSRQKVRKVKSQSNHLIN